MESTVVEKYSALREKIKGLQIRGLEGYDISSAIAIQIWKAVTMSKRNIVLRTFGLLINEKLVIHEDVDLRSNKTALLYVEPVPMREDNIQIFENGVSFLEPCNHIRFELVGTRSVKWLFRKIPCFIRSLVKLPKLPFVLRFYFAASIAVVYEAVSKCNNSNIMKETKELLVFQDHEMMQNIAVQYVHNENGIAISMQHGQRVFRKIDADYMAFDNFISDYTLLWNKFSQSQYIKAGYDKSRLPVVGSTKYAKSDTETYLQKKCRRTGPRNLTIGLILNAPTQFGADEIAAQLLQWSVTISDKVGCKVIAKIHPTDKKEKYFDYAEKGIQFVDPSMSMQDFSELISLGIGHASGALVDLIIMNVPVLLYENEISFPLDLPKSCKFRNYPEMEKCVIDAYGENKSGGLSFSDVRSIYYEENAVEKHKRFFDLIGK